MKKLLFFRLISLFIVFILSGCTKLATPVQILSVQETPSSNWSIALENSDLDTNSQFGVKFAPAACAVPPVTFGCAAVGKALVDGTIVLASIAGGIIIGGIYNNLTVNQANQKIKDKQNMLARAVSKAREAYCWEYYNKTLGDVCRAKKKSSDREACWAKASQLYAACLRGR